MSMKYLAGLAVPPGLLAVPRDSLAVIWLLAGFYSITAKSSTNI